MYQEWFEKYYEIVYGKEVGNNMERICKNCKHSRESEYGTEGALHCTNKKIDVSEYDDHIIDGISLQADEYAQVEVGEEFGCIHFEEKVGEE